MKKQYKDIPTLIHSLEENEIVWQYLADKETRKNRLTKELQECSNKRLGMITQLYIWFKYNIKAQKSTKPSKKREA